MSVQGPPRKVTSTWGYTTLVGPRESTIVDIEPRWFGVLTGSSRGERILVVRQGRAFCMAQDGRWFRRARLHPVDKPC